MSFTYITGVAGSGKSAIANALRELGFSAFDEDASGIGAAHNKQTGLAVPVPSVEHRTPGWFDAHEWRVLETAFTDLASKSGHEDAVLCGNSLSNAALKAVDAKVLYLRIDDSTMVERINKRTDNDYGKTESELAEIRARHCALDDRYLDEAVVIDAARPLEVVVNEVIAHIRGE